MNKLKIYGVSLFNTLKCMLWICSEDNVTAKDVDKVYPPTPKIVTIDQKEFKNLVDIQKAPINKKISFKWYNNGIKNLKVYNNESVPIGYEKGMKKKGRKNGK